MTRDLLKIIFILALLWPVSALATDYYVATTGTNNGSCGTVGSPCKHPQYLIDGNGVGIPARGDTIHIANGTYGSDGGTAGYYGIDGFDYILNIQDLSAGSGYLIIKATNRRQVILDADDDANPFNAGYGALIYNSTGIKFDGIVFQKTGYSAARLAQSASVGPSNDIWFYDCLIQDIAEGDTTTTDNTRTYTGIALVNDSTGSTSPVIIERCEFTGIGRSNATGAKLDWAVYLGGKALIKNSIFYDLRGKFLNCDNGTSCLVYNTTVSDYNDTMLHTGNFIGMGGTTGVTVRLANNIFIDPPNDVLIINYGDDSRDVYAYNNVTDDDLVACGVSPSYCNELGADSNNVEGLSLSTINSQITDLTNGDLSLNGTGLHFVDQANATYAPADDFLGVSRPQGSADDVGAYEYQSLNVSPSVSIVSHVDNDDVCSLPTITGTASDEDGVVSSVAWENTTNEDSGSCSGTTSWNCVITSMSAGNNTIQITATDDDSATGDDSVILDNLNVASCGVGIQ